MNWPNGTCSAGAPVWSGGAAIHIDTGINRLGLTLTEAQGIVPRIVAGDHGITLVMSHLACAENTAIIRSTPNSFRRLPRDRPALYSGVPASLANSSGIYLGAAIPVRPGAAGGCALRRQSDPGGRQSDAAGGRVESPHRPDPPYVERGESVGYGGDLDHAAAEPGWRSFRPAMPTAISAPAAAMTAPAAPRWWWPASAARSRAGSRWT